MGAARHHRTRPNAAVRVARSCEAHPVLTVAVVAATSRVVVALVSFLVNRQYLIPDELQYVQLATTVSEGRPAESWFPVFGQSLYDHTWAFTAPIRLLFDVFWPTRLLGQLYAAAFGVLAAVLTTLLARRIVRRRLALLAGLLVALLPSAVLWSSVVLRESMVWSAMVLLALGFTATFGRLRPALLGVAGMALGLFVLGANRDQTLIAAAWSLPLAALVAGRPRWGARLVVCCALAVVAPMVDGQGPAGWHLVQEAFPSLGTTRAALGDQASSSFTPTTLLSTTTTTPGSGPRSTTTTTLPATVPLAGGGEGQVVKAPSGAVYVVDESFRADLEAVPRGVVAVLLRPFPWEGGSFTLRLAGVEEPIWYALYGLAGAGIWWARRRRDVIALPVVMGLATLGAEVLFQGNVGTAFRHRGQILWVLALLAACGAEALLARRGRPSAAASTDDGPAAPESSIAEVGAR